MDNDDDDDEIGEYEKRRPFAVYIFFYFFNKARRIKTLRPTIMLHVLA